MQALAWGLLFGTAITLVLIPCVYLIENDIQRLVRKYWRRWAGIMMCLFIFLGIGSRPVMASERTVSLHEFITNAAQNDTVFRGLLMQRLSMAYDQDRYVDTYEVAVSVVSEFSVYTNTPGDTHTVALSQIWPRLGQSSSVEYTHLAESSRTQWVFSQDIARNAFGSSARLDHRIQSLKTKIAKHQLVEAYEDYTASLMSLYYTWIRRYESVKLARAAYRENQKVLNSIIDRQKKRVANTNDVNKLKLQTWSKKEKIILFERDYAETSDQMKRAMGLPPTDHLQPDTTIVLDPLPPSVSALFDSPKTMPRTFLILDQLNEQSDLEIDRIAHNLLPSIQLSGHIIHHRDTRGALGISIDLPLKNTQARARHALAKINQKTVEIGAITTIETLKTRIGHLYNALHSQKDLIHAATQKRQLARQILAAESENYSFGKATLNDYIVAVNRYDNARFDEIDRKITYQQLSIEWKRLTDRLVMTDFEAL
ncbi:MAG: TolC family protein, partial [Candidatus Marinamargulisbacteria bacterium]